MGGNEIFRQKRLSILAIILLSFLYFNSLDNEFLGYDDDGLVVKNANIRNLRNIPTIFTSFDGGVYRPLRELSYAFDYWLWALNPVGYHLTNLWIHILNAVLIYSILNLTLRKQTISIMSSLLFAAHPVATESVTWISGRRDILCALFFLLSLLLFIKWSQSRRGHYYLASLISFILSLLSKEMGISLPLILMLYDYCFLPQGTVMRRMKSHYLPFLFIAVFFSFLFLKVSTAQQIPDSWPEHLGLSWWGSKYFVLITVPRIIVFYIRLLLLPINLRPDYRFPLSGSLLDGRLLLSLGLLSCLAIIMVKAHRYLKESFFSLGWFFLTLIPVSNLIVPLNNMVAERYLYIPSIGFCLLITIGLSKASQLKVRQVSSDSFRKAMASFFIFLLATFSLRTIIRNNDWQDNFTLWSAAVKLPYASYRAHHNLGDALERKGMLDEALREYQRALELAPNIWQSILGQGRIYAGKGLYAKSVEMYGKVLELVPDRAEAHYGLGFGLHQQGMLDEAVEKYTISIKIRPEYGEPHNGLGVIYAAQGRNEEAIAEFEKAIEFGDDEIEAESHHNLGLIYSAQGRLDEAISEYRLALRIKPDSAQAHINLGVAYAGKGWEEKAISEFREALEIEPGNPMALQNLRIMEERVGD